MREDDSYRQGKALFAYKGSIKQTMYRFKYSNRREYAAYFAQTAVERYSDWILRCGIDVIIPVPMHRKKCAREATIRQSVLQRHCLKNRHKDGKRACAQSEKYQSTQDNGVC